MEYLIKIESDMDYLKIANEVSQIMGVELPSDKSNVTENSGTRDVPLSDVIAIGSFIIASAQFCVGLWKNNPDVPEFIVKVVSEGKLNNDYSGIAEEERLRILSHAVTRLATHNGSSELSIHSEVVDEKKSWINGLEKSSPISSGNNELTRDFVKNQTILVPFADQKHWILYKDIGWIPGLEDGMAVRVDVPKGFVTDLASIPNYLWPILLKHGVYGNAAIFHDWLYWIQSSSREIADHVFYRTMYDMGVEKHTRLLIWSAVRLFGGAAWNTNRKHRDNGELRVLKDFPNDPTVRWDDWKKKPEVFSSLR